MFVTVGNAPVTTLAALNQALGALTNVTAGAVGIPLTTASFNTAGAPTETEIDQAIAASAAEIYEYVDPSDLVDAVNTELAPIVADPAGFVRTENVGAFAYIADGGFGLNDQATKLLVDAANNVGEARHQTANARGMPGAANGYIHLYGDNALYAFQDNGLHRNVPKVTVLAQGAVNDGDHVF